MCPLPPSAPPPPSCSYQSLGFECTNYELGARVACYCKATLIDRITEKGLISGARDLLSNEVDICGDFVTDFLLANVRYALRVHSPRGGDRRRTPISPAPEPAPRFHRAWPW